MSTTLGRVVFVIWVALQLLVGVAAYLLRNSIDQSLGLLTIAALYVLYIAIAPYVDRLARHDHS